MARVVQRRTGPTYLILTVVFVFLFVIAAVFAVVFYQESQKFKKNAAALEEFLEPVMGDNYLKTGPKQDGTIEYSIKNENKDVQSYARSFLASYPDRKAKSLDGVKPCMLADLLRDRQVVLNTVFPAENMTVEAALKAMASFYDNPKRKEAIMLISDKKPDDASALANSRGCLIPEALTSYELALKAYAKNKELEGQLATEKTKLEEEQKKTTGIQNDVTAKAEQWKNDIAAALAKAEKQQLDYTDKLKEIETEHKTAREKLDKDNADLASDNTALRREIMKLQNDLKAEKTKYAELRRQMVPEQELQIGINGKILRVSEGTDMCYIDIGSDDRIKPGMTFSVYAGRVPRKADIVTKDKSPEQIEKEWDEYLKDKSKGKLVVIETERRFSQCRIVDQKRGNPIMPGDVITNPIVDPIKNFNFVVKGDFDLFGSGRASKTSEERKRKIDQIKKYIIACGGRVTDDIDANTDYVVLGEPPETLGPVDPADDDRVKAIKEQAMRDLEDYNKTRDLAFKIGIPILNTNRFLALTGYVPEKQD